MPDSATDRIEKKVMPSGGVRLICLDDCAINPARIDGIIGVQNEDGHRWTEIYCGGSHEAFIVDLPMEETLDFLAAHGVDVVNDVEELCDGSEAF